MTVRSCEFLKWAGKDFDPVRFDRFAANAALERTAWDRWLGPNSPDSPGGFI